MTAFAICIPLWFIYWEVRHIADDVLTFRRIAEKTAAAVKSRYED